MQREIYLDTETIGTPDSFPDGDDILYQVSYAVTDDKSNLKTFDCYGKPERYQEMAIEAMETTGKTPEDLELYEDIKTQTPWKLLRNISETETYFFTHKADFDLEILKRSGIDISKFKEICTLKIARFINDSLGLPWDSCRLSYLYYKFKLYKLRPALLDELKVDTTTLSSHNSLYDIVDLILLWRYLSKEYNITNEQAHELTKKQIILKHIPSGKHKGNLIEDLNYNSLCWYRDNFYDEDVRYTCKTILERN